MLEHSGLPQLGTPSNLNGFAMPEQQLPRINPQSNPTSVLPANSFSGYRTAFRGAVDQAHGYETSIDGTTHSSQRIKPQPAQRAHASVSETVGAQSLGQSTTGYRTSDGSPKKSGLSSHNGNINKSAAVSPIGSKDRTVGGFDIGLARKDRKPTSMERTEDQSRKGAEETTPGLYSMQTQENTVLWRETGL